MYNKIPIINKHFNHIMKQNPILYQQYTIFVSLDRNTWSSPTIKSQLQPPPPPQQQHYFPTDYGLTVTISHVTKTIRFISTTNPQIRSNDKYDISFEIVNVDEMNRRCPYWYCIKKWRVNINEFDNQISSPQPYYISPYEPTRWPSPPLTPTANINPNILFNNNNKYNNNRKSNGSSPPSTLHELIMTAKPYIKSIEIVRSNSNANPSIIHLNPYSHHHHHIILILIIIQIIQIIHCNKIKVIKVVEMIISLVY